MELEVIELTVLRVVREQLSMLPLFDDFPVDEYRNTISMVNRREAMGNDQDCPSHHESLDCSLDKPFRLIVER